MHKYKILLNKPGKIRKGQEGMETNADTQQFGGGIGQLFSSGVFQKGMGSGIDLATGVFGLKPDEDSTYNQEQQVGNMLLMSGNPYVMAAGAIVKANSALNQAMGTNINTLNEEQRQKIGLSKWANINNTGMGFFTNTVLPGAGGIFGKSIDSNKSQQVDELSGAYSGSADDIRVAGTMGRKRYILGRNKINNFINKSNTANDLITKIGLINTPLIQSIGSNARDYDTQNFKNYNGWDSQSVSTTVGKQGMKLISKEELAKIYKSKVTKPAEPEMFADGGKIGIETNVIPEGALHANKNNLEKVNSELDEVTEKGIPVIVTDAQGDYKQVAEIERDELVLTKDLTTQLEALWKENTPEAMLEAGKLLAKELMENTVNNGDNKDKNSE